VGLRAGLDAVVSMNENKVKPIPTSPELNAINKHHYYCPIVKCGKLGKELLIDCMRNVVSFKDAYIIRKYENLVP
jgi:hypothetical protein